MAYQNKRGGRIVYKDIAMPQKTEWASGLEAMEAALVLEKEVNKSLLELHDLADSKGDKHLCDFLECKNSSLFGVQYACFSSGILGGAS